uniref:hypothetical protein n=1 Tax=Spongiibacter sp. TaxID=2024860 RepID=UPI0035622E7C
MRRRYGFKQLIILMGLMPVLLICLGFSAYLIQQQLADSRQLLTLRAKAAAEQLSVVSAHMLNDQHQSELANITQMALEENGVRAVSIYNHKRQLITHAGPATALPDISAITTAKPFQLIDSEEELHVIWAIFSRQPGTSQPILGWAH